MKVTDRMFEEMVNITKLMINIHNYLEVEDKSSYKKAVAKEQKLYCKLKKHYNWSNKRLDAFWNLTGGLYTQYIGHSILELSKSEDFFNYATIAMLEKDSF